MAKGTHEHALETLLTTLKDHDSDINRNDVAWAFESHQTRDAITGWVGEYLNSDTLLSREELDVYTFLKETGRATISATGEAQLRPREDADVEAALNALQASTAAIEKQCVVLESQKAALMQLRAREACSTSGSSPRELKTRTVQQSRAQSSREIDDMAEKLHQSLALNGHRSASAMTEMDACVHRQLEADDRLFEKLQRVVDSISSPNSNASSAREVEQLCTTLVSLRASATKKRINNVYHDAYNGSNDDIKQNGHGAEKDLHDDTGEEAALVQELDTLMAEIDSVVAMVVDQEYRTPMLDALRQIEASRYRQQKEWREYARDSLSHMTDRLERLTLHTQDLQGYSATLTAISDALTETMASPTKHAADTTIPEPPAAQHKRLKELVLRPSKPHDPAEELLRHYNLRIVRKTNDMTAVPQQFEATLADLRERITSLAASTELGMTSQLVEALCAADGELQPLKEALMAHSPYATINLADRALTDALDGLDGEIASASRGMARLGADELVAAYRQRHEAIMQSGA